MKIFPPFLNQGSRGPAVRVLQCLLHGRHDSPNVTGNYDELTANAVKTLQVELGFRDGDVDGNFGPATRAAFSAQFGVDVDLFMIHDFTGMTYYMMSDPDKVGDRGRVWNDVGTRK